MIGRVNIALSAWKVGAFVLASVLVFVFPAFVTFDSLRPDNIEDIFGYPILWILIPPAIFVVIYDILVFMMLLFGIPLLTMNETHVVYMMAIRIKLSKISEVELGNLGPFRFPALIVWLRSGKRRKLSLALGRARQVDML